MYLPGLASIPPIDRDESRFAQASRQMFESAALLPSEQLEPLHAGGYIEPRVGEKSRLNKPPLIYWLQSGSAALFTQNTPPNDAIWMYRVPSVLSAMLAVLLTWRAGLLLFDPRAAALGAALLAISPMVIWDAHQARADQLLLATTTATFWLLAAIYTRASGPKGDKADRFTRVSSWLLPIALATTIALSILAKGPIAPLIVLLTLAALALTTRRWRWMRHLRPLTVLAIVLALTLPWLIAVAARVGFGTYFSEVIDETLGRSAAPKEGHWGPPGYHTVLLAVLFWPGVILTALSITRAARRAWGTEPTTETHFPLSSPVANAEGAREAGGGGAFEPTPDERARSASEGPPSSPPWGEDDREAGGRGATQSEASPPPLSSPVTEGSGGGGVGEADGGGLSEPSTTLDSDDDPDIIPLAPEPEPTPRPTPPKRANFPLDTDDDNSQADATPDEPTTLPRVPLTVRLRRFWNTITRRPTGRRPELFCLCWILPAWLFFELISTKLPHYTLPLYPAIALLSARGLLSATAGTLKGLDDKGTRLGLQLWLLIGATLTVAAPLAIALFSLFLAGPTLGVIPALVLILACAALLWFTRDAISRSLLTRATILSMLAAILGFANLVGVVIPSSRALHTTTRLMAIAESAGWTTAVPIASAGYHEDSLTFATRARVQRIELDDTASWATRNSGLLIAPAGTHTTLQADPRARTTLLETITGYNYSTGKIVQLEVLMTGAYRVP